MARSEADVEAGYHDGARALRRLRLPRRDSEEEEGVSDWKPGNSVWTKRDQLLAEAGDAAMDLMHYHRKGPPITRSEVQDLIRSGEVKLCDISAAFTRVLHEWAESVGLR